MISQAISFNIDEVALEIERVYGSFMPAYPKGIYAVGGEKPLMEEGKYYYSLIRRERNKFREIPVKTFAIKDIHLPIYDDNGLMVINEMMVQNKVRMLAYRPTVAVNGRRICTEYIEGLINTIVTYSKNRNHQPLYVLVKTLFKENYMSFDEFRENIRDLCVEFGEGVRKFVKSDPNQIYSVRRVGGVVTVTMLGDYRIEESKFNTWLSNGDRSSIE